MSYKTKEKLKGGSLSQTSLITYLDGTKFIRKEVSISKNREYGFRRWYSQLKRQQRYNLMFPGLFPDILRYGIDGDNAYFDMVYVENSMTALEYIMQETDIRKIDTFFDILKLKMNRLHGIKIKSCTDMVDLYSREEVVQSLAACTDINFIEFAEREKIIYNGQTVDSFVYNDNVFAAMLRNSYKESHESFSHGNLTLENILYVPSEYKIVFIDGYEENIIDSPLADYSQLLQSCNSRYETINDLIERHALVSNDKYCVITNDSVSMRIPENHGLEHFNKIFNDFLKEKLTNESYTVVKLLEVSQFIRMLPFKQETSVDKMKVFYALASKLFYDLKTNYGIN